MEGVIHVSDHPRLFLFQALEHGLSLGLYGPGVVQQLKQEGVDLTIGFVKRMFPPADIFDTERLEYGASVVLGIIALGLAFESSGDVSVAAPVLGGGFTRLFRQGWGKVHYLASLIETAGCGYEYRAQSIAELEAAVAGEFAVTEDGVWTGVADYNERVDEYAPRATRARFCAWLMQQYGGANAKELPEAGALSIAHYTEGLMMTLVAHTEPVSNLTFNDCSAIIESICDGSAQVLLEAHAAVFLESVPSEFVSVYHVECAEFLDRRLPGWRKTFEEDGVLELYHQFLLYYGIDVPEISLDSQMYRMLVSAEEQWVAGASPNNLIAYLDAVDPERPLVTQDEEALVEALIQKQDRAEVSIVAAILMYGDPKQWRRKILWTQFRGTAISEIIELIEGRIRNTVLVFRDMFEGGVRDGAPDWWSDIPTNIAYEMYGTLTCTERPKLVSLLGLDARRIFDEVTQGMADMECLALLAPNKLGDILANFLTAWSDSLPNFLSRQEMMPFPEHKKVAYCIRVALSARMMFRREAKADPELESASPPFFMPDLEMFFQRMLTPDQFEELKAKIS